jgi:hypothetical protein
VSLLDFSRQRLTRLAARRDALLRQARERAADVGAQEAVVAELSRVQRSYAIGNAACLLALYGTALTAQQVAAYAVGSYPYAPSKFALTEVLMGDEEAQRMLQALQAL